MQQKIKPHHVLAGVRRFFDPQHENYFYTATPFRLKFCQVDCVITWTIVHFHSRNWSFWTLFWSLLLHFLWIWGSLRLQFSFTIHWRFHASLHFRTVSPYCNDFHAPVLSSAEAQHSFSCAQFIFRFSFPAFSFSHYPSFSTTIYFLTRSFFLVALQYIVQFALWETSLLSFAAYFHPHQTCCIYSFENLMTASYSFRKYLPQVFSHFQCFLFCVLLSELSISFWATSVLFRNTFAPFFNFFLETIIQKFHFFCFTLNLHSFYFIFSYIYCCLPLSTCIISPSFFRLKQSTQLEL